MSVVALFAWIATILPGLLMLVIWLMEYDRETQSSAMTRLPVPVISAHALLGGGGLILWVDYLVMDEQRLAWVTVAVLGGAAVLGLTLAARWIHVFRAYANPGPALTRTATIPPERNFPLSVVIIHGLLAVTTFGLVLFTVLDATSA